MAARQPRIPDFPRNGTPPDQHGWPHYQEIRRANEQLERWYRAECRRRREDRQALLLQGAAGTRRARWARRVREVRKGLADRMGLRVVARAPEPPAAAFEFASPIAPGGMSGGLPHWAAALQAIYYRLPAVSWDDEDIEVLVLRPKPVRAGLKNAPAPRRGRTGFRAALVLPDSGPCLLGSEGPEAAARSWGCALALSGLIVAIPRMPGYARFSGTRNKQRLQEGACALGEVLHEAARTLDFLLGLPGVDGPRAWTVGHGVGATLALMLGALDARVGGVVADAPSDWASAEDPQAFLVPRANKLTDLPELAALQAPRPLALLRAPAGLDPFGAPHAEAAILFKAAQPAYALAQAGGRLKLFMAGAQARAMAWAHAHGNALDAPGASAASVVRGPRPEFRYAVSRCETLSAWQHARPKLRQAYRAIGGIPKLNKPLRVVAKSRTELPDATRFEYHIHTGPHSCCNLSFYRPRGPQRRRTTVLCLPGSGSDVGRVEAQFAHEVLAEGWNAAVIDARVALFPFHPDIPENGNRLNQSVHDLLCALDYVAGREDVDPKRIATMGVSQGGTHSWLLAALDERIAAAAPVCGLCTWNGLVQEERTRPSGAMKSLYLDSHGIYYFTPGVLQFGDQQDLCALIAPRPLCFIGATRDDCFPLDGMRACDRDLRRIYRMFGAARNYRYVEFEGIHSMPEHTRRTAYAFFRKHLK